MMMEAENVGDTTSYNIVGEITGTEFPKQVTKLSLKSSSSSNYLPKYRQ